MLLKQTFQDTIHTGNDLKIIEELSERKIIKISNSLALSSMDIKETSLNLFLVLISEIIMEDTVLPIYDIPLSEIKNKIGKRQHRSQEQLEHLRSDLKGNNIKLIGHDERIPLCSEFEIIIEENIQFLRIEINPDLKDELLGLSSKFTRINLDHILLLQGFYAKKFYMYIQARKGLKKWKENLTSLYDIINVSGSYAEYRSFKPRILLDAISKIKKLEDNILKVKFDEIKRGSRSVKQLEFNVISSDKKSSGKSSKKQQAKEEDPWENFGEPDHNMSPFRNIRNI